MNNFTTKNDIDREGFRLRTPVTEAWTDFLPENFSITWGEKQEPQQPQTTTQQDNTKWIMVGGIALIALFLFSRK